MDNPTGSQSVRVAVNIRPLLTHELLVGCSDCISVTPGEPQVQIGAHSFTFDYVYGGTGSTSSRIFADCVAPLVDALFHGYNATVLAYGQTGSGKTHTMGTNYNVECTNGIIPKVMQTIFRHVEETIGNTEYLIRVSFIEVFKEEVFDLLESSTDCTVAYSKGDGNGKGTGPSRAPIQIRETANGGISLAGVTEAEVTSQEEMALFLQRGCVCRATGSTNMNSKSSRSHAIFTISMEQKRNAGDEILSAKLHLVDLAGSERAKKTGADGMRLREGIHINRGLLALGNVISSLGDDKKRKEGGHVPYRDSKLTRLLQDSLGGNSKTVMIACVSPADTNAEETLNTLKYANRARNIQNKAIVNRDPVTAQMQIMKNQIEQLQAELLYVKGDSSTPFEELQILKQKIALLERSNLDLQKQLQEHQANVEYLTKQATDAQFEKNKLLLKIESALDGKPWDEIDCDSNKDVDVLRSYKSRIQELEAVLLQSKRLNSSKRNEIDYLDSDDNAPHPKSCLFPESDSKTAEVVDNFEDEEKELEHFSLQEKLDNELKELDKRLEQKEVEMKRVAGGDTSVLKQHYEKKVQDLEQEKRNLQKEIEQLRCNLANISSNSDDQKLKENYLQKLKFLESQVSELKKKQDAQAQLLRQKQKSDEAAKKLQDEIHRIKTQKVQLQQKIKQESEQFRQWKASREKEVLKLKKEGRRNEYEMHKLLALNQRQKMVLQRKTEEASMATKRLKDILETRKTSRETYGPSSGAGIQALLKAIEHELEVTVRVHEVRCEYERQKEERLKMAKEVAELKDEANLSKQSPLSHCSQTMSPAARNSRIYALENMLATLSSTIVSMASQLSEAEERERGKGRWNHVGSLADAKTVMNNLFNLASSSRCHLWDKEVACREKDWEIKGLKEKIVFLIRQLEMQKLVQQRLMSKSFTRNPTSRDSTVMEDVEGHAYDLRPKEPRNSIAESEDMDTSESEDQSDLEDEEDDIEWLHSEDFQDEMGRKCSNREPVSVDMKPTVTVGNVNISGDASQGAMSALSDGTKRKPLADIGNTTFEKDQLLLKLKARDEFENNLDPKSSLFPEAIGDFGDEEEELELDKRLDNCGTAFKKSTLHHPPFSDAEEDWPLEDISASEHTPRGPHFIQHMKKSYLNHLYVPAQFAAHLPRNNNVELVIRNTDGKSWKIKSSYKKNKQSQSLTFSAGWPKFIQDSDIRVGDVCIIELVGDSELKVLITKVRNPSPNPSPAYVNEMPPPPRLYGTRSSGPVATLSPIELVSCHGYRKAKRKEDCLRCSICPKHFCVKSLMNKFQYLEADIPNINPKKWLCPSCQGLCNCKHCKGKLTIIDFLAELPSSSSSSSSHALYEELKRSSQPLLAYLNRANTMDELMKLPLIGVERADSILQIKQELQGEPVDVDDLRRVRMSYELLITISKQAAEEGLFR